jgi:predicted membrane protein
MKNLRRAIWGLIFVAAAVVIALNSFDIIDFNIFFEGWWTLFIIVPSFAGLITDRDKSGSIFGLCLGIFLLLCARDILDFDMIWKLILPAIIAYIGLKMIFSSFRKNKAEKIINKIKVEGRDLQNGTAVFCGTELDFDNAVFDGADLTAVFGGVDCDIRHAIIDRDCVIKVCSVFGGIDIKVPDNVKVVTNTTSVFGGIDVHKSNPNGIHTLYIEGVCMFGGVDVK